MWGVCDRCHGRIVTEATMIQLQDGELVRLSDGLPRLKAAGSSQLHTLCRTCGSEVGAALKQLMGEHIVTASL